MNTKVDVISGFLGAGKTTLIKKLLKDALTGSKVVLIENEFGEIGIDGGFLKQAGIEIREMNAGCICCSLVGDFDASLQQVMTDYEPERIIIEPSGVGKLSDVMNAIKNVADKTGNMELNAAATVIDCIKAKSYIKNFGEFITDQLENAGTVILTRTDKADQSKIEETVDLIRSYNKKATIITTPIEELGGKEILNTLEGTRDLAAEIMAEAVAAYNEEECDDPECSCHHHGEGHHHHHDEDHECCHGRGHHHHHDEDHECCHGKGHHHHDEDHECCHGEGHHHHDEDHECCHGEGHHHHHDEDHECCHGEGHHHHDEDHECCHGRGHHHHDEDHECCHGGGYHHHHDEDHECCHGEGHHHHDEDHECCHGEGHHHHDEDGVIVHNTHDHHHHHHGHSAEEVFGSWGMETPHRYSAETIKKLIASLEDEKVYGMVLRAKGIVQDESGSWIEFDHVPEETQVRCGAAADVTGKIVVIGSKLNEEALEKLFREK